MALKGPGGEQVLFSDMVNKTGPFAGGNYPSMGYNAPNYGYTPPQFNPQPVQPLGDIFANQFNIPYPQIQPPPLLPWEQSDGMSVMGIPLVQSQPMLPPGLMQPPASPVSTPSYTDRSVRPDFGDGYGAGWDEDKGEWVKKRRRERDD